MRCMWLVKTKVNKHNNILTYTYMFLHSKEIERERSV